jgi:hypothetical protein
MAKKQEEKVTLTKGNVTMTVSNKIMLKTLQKMGYEGGGSNNNNNSNGRQGRGQKADQNPIQE